MSKEKYQIIEKSVWISLTVIKYDLQCYSDQLHTHASDINAMVARLRSTSNIFIALKNLNDALDRVNKIHNKNLSPAFIEKTKVLRKRVDFVNHIRNKSSGHIDPKLSERAAQWIPDIFHASCDENAAQLFSYRALIEASINSCLGPSGRQKIFNHEIDLFYPPDNEEFYTFLDEVISDSLEWLADAISHLDKIIVRHDHHQLAEISCIAGQTNFDLNSESDFSFDRDKFDSTITKTIEKLEESGEVEAAEGLRLMQQHHPKPSA